MKKHLAAIGLILILNLAGVAQPTPFHGTLIFNLIEKEYSGNSLSIQEFERKNIRLLTKYKNGKLTYDSVHKAFSVSTYGIERKEFAIVYNGDTIFIDYPSLPSVKAVVVIMPIPLSKTSISFSNKFTYDAMHSNKGNSKDNLFYLCQGCFLSTQYEMSPETKKKLDIKRFIYEVELEK